MIHSSWIGTTLQPYEGANHDPRCKPQVSHHSRRIGVLITWHYGRSCALCEKTPNPGRRPRLEWWTSSEWSETTNDGYMAATPTIGI